MQDLDPDLAAEARLLGQHGGDDGAAEPVVARLGQKHEVDQTGRFLRIAGIYDQAANPPAVALYDVEARGPVVGAIVHHLAGELEAQQVLLRRIIGRQAVEILERPAAEQPKQQRLVGWLLGPKSHWSL